MPRQLQFVVVADPAEIPSETRKLCRSHVTRQAHAKKRRLQMQRFQEEGARSQMDGDMSRPNTLVSLTKTPCGDRDSFSAIARPLSPGEHFLLDYYVRTVVPITAAKCDLFGIPELHAQRTLSDWVSLAITDPDFLDTGILLNACRYVLFNRPDDPILTRMALQYKQSGLRALRHALGQPVRFPTVATAFALALDEKIFGDMEVAQVHLRGVFSMVEGSGGPRSLGLPELFERLYRQQASSTCFTRDSN